MIHPTRYTKGFTLVELAIVLVILGLIISGILVGQTLIRSGEMRATISQIEKYNAAVTTFRTRFNALPGDLENAGAYDLPALGGGSGEGDGNEMITGVGGALTADGEITLFWEQLTAIGTIYGKFDGAQTNGTIGGTFPPAQLGRFAIGVYNEGAKNYFHIGINNATGTTYNAVNILSPEEALNMDIKTDDGAPNSGATRAKGTTTPNGLADDTAGTGCVTGAAVADTYQGHTDIACQLRLRMN